MIAARNISLELGTKVIFDNVTFMVQPNQKVGIVGRNGAGKSTLLKVISGIIPLDDGVIEQDKSISIGYLPQDVVLLSKRPVFEEAFGVFDELVQAQKRLHVLEQILADDKELSIKELDEYAHLQETLMLEDPDQKKRETMKVLRGLGFSDAYLEKTVDQLSVGWRMRLVLAKLLLQKPDFFLFDEPTNHLDIVAKDWFLEFLKHSSSGFFFVSHDRYFLDHLSEYILFLERGKAKLYTGNFAKFEKQRVEELAVEKKRYDEQQGEIKRKKKTIERFRAKSSKAKMAKSMEKSLDRMERIERAHYDKDVKFRFPSLVRSGKVVLKVENVAHAFDGTQLFGDVNCEVNRGDKVALVAGNGVGKTTLFNLMTGKYDLQQGSVTLGHNVSWSLFEQDQDKVLDPRATILDEVESVCKTTEQRSKVRAMLGSFLFPGDDVDKKIGVLSGGEKNRVAMVKVLLQPANFLMLDEPTNHLDLQSKEILLKALKAYTGTVLFVSHDRDFLDHLATKVLELSPQGLRAYDGNYSDYLYYKDMQESGQQPVDQKKEAVKVEEKVEKKSHKSGKQAFEQRKKLKRLEQNLEKTDKKIKELQAKLGTVEYGSDEYHEMVATIDKQKVKLSGWYKEWEEVQ